MWEYIFDYQQRIITQDKLSMNELCLLFYFSKQIINQEFMEAQNPSEYKDFLYADIVKALPILNIEVKQLKNLIKKLHSTRYINIVKIFAGVSVSLTSKALTSLSKKQFAEPGNKKYFFLLKWKNISTLQNENGKKFPTFYLYYLYITNNKLYNNININSLDTEEDIINKSSNINKRNLLLPLFEKYSQFKTNLLDDIKLPQDFDCQKLIQAVDESCFLRNKIGIKFLIKHYDYALRGDYKGEDKEDKPKLLVKDAKDIGVQQTVFDQEEYSISLDMREKLKNIEKEQEQLLLQLREQAVEKLRENNKFYTFDELSEAEQEELIEIYVAEHFAKCSQTE